MKDFEFSGRRGRRRSGVTIARDLELLEPRIVLNSGATPLPFMMPFGGTVHMFTVSQIGGNSSRAVVNVAQPTVNFGIIRTAGGTDVTVDHNYRFEILDDSDQVIAAVEGPDMSTVNDLSVQIGRDRSLFPGGLTTTLPGNPSLDGGANSIRFRFINTEAGLMRMLGPITVCLNRTPVGQADSYTIAEGGSISATDATGSATPANAADNGVIANDSDLDGDTLTAALVAGFGPQHDLGTFTLNANGTFSYQHDGSETTSDSFRYTLSDGQGGTAGPFTASITITPVNDPPINTVPAGTLATAQNTPLIFDGVGNRFSVSDADAGANPIRVTLEADRGTLTLSGVDGLTFSEGDGTDDPRMVFSGSQGQLNAAIDGLTFLPEAGFAGTASVSITTDDLGNAPPPSRVDGPDSVAIQVNSSTRVDRIVEDTGLADIPATSSDRITADRSPSVFVAAEPGSMVTVTIRRGGMVVVAGAATPISADMWRFDVPVALADGSYLVQATANPPAGDPIDSAPVELRIDATAPDAPTPTAVVVGDPADPLSVGDGAITPRNRLLAVSGTVPTAGEASPPIRIELFLVRPGGATESVGMVDAEGGSWSAAVDQPTLADGVYALFARAVDRAGNRGEEGPRLTLTIDTLAPSPAAVPLLLPESNTGVTDLLGGVDRDTVTGAEVLRLRASGIEAGTRVELLRFNDGAATPEVVDAVDGASSGDLTLTDPGAPEGVLSYRVRQIDAAGNSSESMPLPVFEDRSTPTFEIRLAQADRTFTGDLGDPGIPGDPSDDRPGDTPATTRSRPNFEVVVADAPGGFRNGLIVELLAVDDVVLDSTVIVGRASPENARVTTLSLQSPMAFGPGSHSIVVRVRDIAGNISSLTNEPRPGVREARFEFNVLDVPPRAAPGTPTFATQFDLSGLVAPGPDGADPEGLFPWNLSFDRTTQTVWTVLRGEALGRPPDRGNHVVQIDPAIGPDGQARARVFDVGAILQGTTLADRGRDSGPHSVFFDFETHLGPRVWFTQRETGLVSYLDIASGELVTYDVRGMLQPLQEQGLLGDEDDLADVHAITVDKRGVTWITDSEDGILLELDTRLGSDRGTLTVHFVPPEVLGGITKDQARLILSNGHVGPHGLDVVVDDRDGQPYVYFTELGPGRIALLRPGQADRGTEDRWVYWDLNAALEAEGSVSDDGLPVGLPLFTSIDDAETPGIPEDDRILFGDPGSRAGLLPNSAVRVLESGNVIRALRAESTGGPPLGSAVTHSTIRTFRIPATPAGNSSRPVQPNQVYVDRQGNVFFADRRSGIGRVDTLSVEGNRIDAPVVPLVGRSAMPLPNLVPSVRTPDGDPPFVPLPVIAAQRTVDASVMAGLDNYALAGPTGGNQGQQSTGPFRGTINAGSTVYGSLTQNDQLGTLVFAETARRPLSVIELGGGGRMAFQVLRSGRLILTERGPGQVVDRQTDLTAATGGPSLASDPSAAVDAAGVVHVFARDRDGGLSEYDLDPALGGWRARSLGRVPESAGVLASPPSAFVLDTGMAGALLTTGTGHLVLFLGGVPGGYDLTPVRGDGTPVIPIYGHPGVVVEGGSAFAYGADMNGQVVEYRFPSIGGLAVVRPPLELPDTMPPNSELNLFQDVEVLQIGDERHLFGTDGSSRLVHLVLGPDGNVRTAENVTTLTQAGAVGYSPYQQPFAARVYSDVSAAVDPTNGDLFVYGTNGRDLVEFRHSTDGTWSAANLTNTLSGTGAPANFVFGAPSVSILPNGDRQILQINADGETIEYNKLNGLAFATFNISLSQNNQPSLPDGPFLPNQQSPPPPTPTPLRPLAGGSLFVGEGRIETAGSTGVFLFTAPRSGRVALSTATPGSRLDTQLTILDDQLRPIAANDNLGGSIDSRVALDVEAGRDYLVVVAGNRGTVGTYQVRARYVASGSPVATAAQTAVSRQAANGSTGEETSPTAWSARWSRRLSALAARPTAL